MATIHPSEDITMSDSPAAFSATDPDLVEDLDYDPNATSEEEESDYISDSDDEDDPVVKEYKVFITSPPSQTSTDAPRPDSDLYIMQFIGRPDTHRLAGDSAPTELRMKPSSGYFEVDVPLDIHNNYDRQKGVRFGEAMRRTKGFGQPGYGEAAGFQRVMPKSTRRPGAPATAGAGGGAASGGRGGEDEEGDAEDQQQKKDFFEDDNLDEWVNNFEDANEKGHVLNTVTWGGRLLGQEAWKPNYMIGAFRGDELHLTPLRGIVQLRPELHHLDATAHLEAASRRRETTDPKDVLPTVKKLTDEKTAEELLKGSAQEKWTKMGWIDCMTDVAEEARRERLYLKDTENAEKIEWEAKKEYIERVLPVVVGREGPIQGSKGATAMGR